MLTHLLPVITWDERRSVWWDEAKRMMYTLCHSMRLLSTFWPQIGRRVVCFWWQLTGEKVKPWIGNYHTLISKPEFQRPCNPELAWNTTEGVVCLSKLRLSAPEPAPLLVRNASGVSQAQLMHDCRFSTLLNQCPWDKYTTKTSCLPHSCLLAFN